jgi:hypothetical protein
MTKDTVLATFETRAASALKLAKFAEADGNRTEQLHWSKVFAVYKMKAVSRRNTRRTLELKVEAGVIEVED